mgnify:CR=1 FL=1
MTIAKSLMTGAFAAVLWGATAGGQVLGTFAIYHRTPHRPAPPHLRLIELTASLVSLALERMQTEERLHLAASVFTQHTPFTFIASLLSLERLRQTNKVGGWSVTEQTAEAVKPRVPTGPAVVMMFTAAARRAIASR